MSNKQKKNKGISVQDLIGIRCFSDYGIKTNFGELLFFIVTPTNISVLSHTSIDEKIRELMLVLSAVPDIEITCTDSAELFEDNKSYLSDRMASEESPKIKEMLKQDIRFLDQIQLEMATARHFMFVARCKGMKPHQVFERANSINKIISEQGFDCHRMSKSELKRMLAIYFDATVFGEQLPDYDGLQNFDILKMKEESNNV